MGDRSDAVQERGADVVHRCEQARRLILGADDAPHHRAYLAHVELGGEQVDGRHGHRGEEAVDGARRCGDELAVEAHHLGRLLDRPEGRSGHQRGADRMRAELERGDDAEVPAAAAQRPEQVRVLVGARADL